MIKNIKPLALCSGGFDSVVMINHMVKNLGFKDFPLLFFNYKQPNLQEELNASKKIAQKFNLELIEIELPKFEWCTSGFYSNDPHADKYVEARNTIFLSYAFSICEAKGYNAIYTAVLNSRMYIDATKKYLRRMGKVASLYNIKIHTPFKRFYKDDLFYLAGKLGVREGDFFSCMTPFNGKPCGECQDCDALRGYLG